ncbi:MAG: biofilm formation regulator BssR [Yokenella regensburgei]|uniref:Biofilm formation regulatory protein BssR n=1 Tax=Yokenella regensburgei TaxID=158877 RepID=A0AB38FQ95_9ENTR|nr:biofilm formation regulator BssR [Yokenella regensburgei]KAF1371111.1 biofilm regulator BssR [Yokenella regensburgei]KFD19334.1 BssR family biofilm regulator [Yokenella regensburgei ATCC 49455]MDQ4431511.1 biofilm formation regulator BssR [Yokenella regensburgei]MDR3104583.1 biofilm formation regulator BssR [Yokenella regensburgei]QIU88098.1 biofilm formation regulator BssR [Yokenella regensburgei]
MNVDRLRRNLMNKLINARIDLAAYLQLRKAKGYMSVSENDHLRENLFELCDEMRHNAGLLKQALLPEEQENLRQAGEAIASAAVCLLSGHHDCPLYIAVNVDTLERCLNNLTNSIHKLNAFSSPAHV